VKLKLDENGNAVLADGKPVYIHPDGKEAPFDAEAAVRRITNLTEEKDRHYSNVEKLKEKIAAFEGIEDPEKAKKALETLKNLDDKKLIDAGEVDALKRQMAEVFEQERAQLTQQLEQERSEAQEKLESSAQRIRRLMIDSQFSKSPWFSGEQPKTILPPDIAAEHFGKFFKVEEDSVVGYLNGNKILSRERVGEPAGFEEALSVIIDGYPMKDRILRESGGGSGSAGNTGAGSGNSISRASFDQMSPHDRAAFVSKGGTVSD